MATDFDDTADHTFDDEDAIMRRFSIAQQFQPSKLQIDKRLRLFLSFLLKEPEWVASDVDGAVIDQNGLVVLTAKYDTGQGTTQIAGYPLCPESYLKKELLELSRRAGLSDKDESWLVSLPGVKDLRNAEPGW